MQGLSIFNLINQVAARSLKLLKSVELRDLRPQLDLPLGKVQQEEFFWRATVAAGQLVEIKGVNGSIRAEAHSGQQVELRAIKSGRRTHPREVEIKILEHEQGFTIGALYKSDDPRRANELVPGAGGRMRVRRNDVSVEFIIRIPAGVRFSGKTVNGSIEASLSSSNLTGATELKTVNGNIRLELPAETAAEVHAATANGSVWLGFSLTRKVFQSRKKIVGTIGNPVEGRRLMLKTANGSIQVRASQGAQN